MGNQLEKRSSVLTAETVITPNGTAVTALPEQPARQAWWIKAGSANTGIIYFRLGGVATALIGTPLTAGQAYAEPLAGNAIWDGSVSVFCSAGTDTAMVVSY